MLSEKKNIFFSFCNIYDYKDNILEKSTHTDTDTDTHVHIYIYIYIYNWLEYSKKSERTEEAWCHLNCCGKLARSEMIIIMLS